MMTDPEQLPLRDIHLPQAIGWWPPAPGWWLALAFFGVLLLICVRWWRSAKNGDRPPSLKSLSLRDLETIRRDYSRHGDAQRLIRELSALLRRISMSYWPRERSASLTGKSWLRFLDRTLEQEPFTTGPGKALLEAPYRPDPQFEAEPLLKLCHDWIDALPDPDDGGQS